MLVPQPTHAAPGVLEPNITVAPKTVRPRFNSTGRTIVIDAPVQLVGRERGELPLTIEADDRVLVEGAKLAEIVAAELNDEHRASVVACLNGAGQVDRAAAQSCGVELAFDPSQILLTIDMPSESVRVRPIGGYDVVLQPNILPALFSGFLNYDVAYEQDWLEGKGGVRLDLEGALRYGGVVLEAEALIDGPISDFICPIEAKCDPEHRTGFKRRGTRLVYDSFDDETRYVLGDVFSTSGYSNRLYDIAGVQLLHSPLAFGRDVRQGANQSESIVLDGPTEVEVIVNGVPLQRLRLEQGSYSLKDLPIAIGSNDVEIVLTDQYGNRDVRSFLSLTSDELLAPGETEWSFASGLPSYWNDGERDYLTDDVQTHAYLRHGLMEHLTGLASVDADFDVINSGVGVQALSPFGLWSLGVSASFALGEDATGASVKFGFESFCTLETRRVIRLTGEYRTQSYFEPGLKQRGHGDVLYPVLDSPLRLTATWSEMIADDWSAVLSARYRMGGNDAWEPGAVSIDTDRWIVEAGVSRPLSPWATCGLQLGYGNEGLLTFGYEDAEPSFRVGGRMSLRLNTDTRVSTGHDTSAQRTSVDASHRVRSEDADWSANLAAYHTQDRGTTMLGNVTRMNDRGYLSVAHASAMPESGAGVGIETERSRVGYSGSVAFADGLYTAGAPIHGGFAIVAPHKTIESSTVIVGSIDRPRATGDSTLPALVPDLPAYMTTSTSLDATDLPTGYSLGESGFAVRSPYKAGYAVTVGSDYAVSVVGTLKDAGGNPVSLVSGIATSTEHAGRSVTLFTNRAGRFAADGLAPGQWQLAVADQVYAMAIPSTAVGYHDAGTLTPSSR